MKRFYIDNDGRIEVYSEAKLNDILGEVWGKCQERNAFNDDESEVHEEYVKLGHVVGAWHEDGGFGWVELPHWLHDESHIDL